MRISLTKLIAYFNEASKMYFNGQLTHGDSGHGGKVRIEITGRTVNRVGFFIHKDNISRIVMSEFALDDSIVTDNGTPEWKNTLVHEMVHFYQWLKFKKSDHGDTFIKKAQQIRAIDRTMIIQRYATGKMIGQIVNNIRRQRKGLPSQKVDQPINIQKPKPQLQESPYLLLHVKGKAEYYLIKWVPAFKATESYIKKTLDLLKAKNVMITLYRIITPHKLLAMLGSTKSDIPKMSDVSEIDKGLQDLNSFKPLEVQISKAMIDKAFDGNADANLKLIYSWKN
jgi:hypothetical protein